MPVTQEQLDEIALTKAEYDLIVDRLDREPNPVELGMFGALWSEHCAYKHSAPLLRLLPSRSPRVLSRQGAENAGAVDLGDGLVAVFKVESHNHPSAVEPLQGAATGVGGIVRDILAMGARPVALLNSLRFGPLDDPANRHLFQGVVGGISWYGNCIGVPDVAGEIYFDPCYSQNPLVNAMCVGLVERDKLATASAGAQGNVLLLVGSGTGRDGIHGASGLASRTFEQDQELRPTVQVGNPFLEKVLIEACLEALGTGWVRGIQDLGAAGLTSASVESAARAGRGIVLDVSRVPRRERGMDPYEVMLSESQERMLLIVPPEGVSHVKEVFDRWDVACTEIGVVTAEPEATVVDDTQTVASVPITHLVDPPRYRLKGSPPPGYQERQRLSLSDVPMDGLRPEAVLLELLASGNIASREPVFRRYDHQVQTNTVEGPGGDAAVLRLKGTAAGRGGGWDTTDAAWGGGGESTEKAIALSIDGNGRYCYLDPYHGGQITVAEVCRNLSCSGATPVALTDCLNFGDPGRPDVYYQLEWCVRGMAYACRALGVPVVSGNVSLYNESMGQAIFPTPIVGGLGIIEDVAKRVGSAFPSEDTAAAWSGGRNIEMVVALLGDHITRPRASDLAGSEYLRVIHGKLAGRPVIVAEYERRLQALCRRAVEEGLLASAHDCSDGGLAVALAESCVRGGVGFSGSSDWPRRWDAALFGERQSRILVSLPQSAWPVLERMGAEYRIPVRRLGTTGGDRFRLGSLLDLPLADIASAWNHGLTDAARGGGRDTMDAARGGGRDTTDAARAVELRNGEEVGEGGGPHNRAGNGGSGPGTDGCGRDSEERL